MTVHQLTSDADLHITQIASRYGVTMKQIKGKRITWALDSARAEICWTLATKYKTPKTVIADIIGRKPKDVALFIKRQEAIIAWFQNEADRQHQSFLKSPDGAHIAEELETAKAEVEELKRKLAWNDGCRGDGVRRAEGFTEVETRIIRIMVSRESGRISHEQQSCLWRHMSNIRKKLPHGVTVKTLIGEGYQLTGGRELLQTLLMGGGRDNLPRVAAKPKELLLEHAA